MAAHLTPLKRPQLFDLCGLIDSVLQEVSSSSITRKCDSNGDMASRAPVSGGNNIINCTISDGSHVNGVFKGDKGSKPSKKEHPLVTGNFCDVFEDPYTKDKWRLYDKILYVVWWSHRPPFCRNCGMQNAWMPSAESEAKCWNCGSDAGSTAVNDVVKDDEGVDAINDGRDNDESNRTGGVGNSGMGFSSISKNVLTAAGSGAVSLYTFFYEWIAYMRSLKHFSGILLPSGEGLAQVLRAAYDLAMLLVIPGTPGSGAIPIWGGSLYLSMMLCSFSVPFPLFQMGSNFKKLESNCGQASSEDRSFFETLQWVDVELLATLIGVTPPDFFESYTTAVCYIRDVMSMIGHLEVPDAIWSLEGDTTRQEVLKSMILRRRRSAKNRGATSHAAMSPEHTAMIVILEFARSFDSSPCTFKKSGYVGKWLHKNGFYPERTCYPYNNSIPLGVGDINGHPQGQGGDDVLCCAPAIEDKVWFRSQLACSSSPFYERMRLVLTSPCANALLYVFADVFSMSPLELADMARSSGLYTGTVHLFEVLQAAALGGNYTLMPLCHRLSPLTSIWTSVYFAAHSSDRLPLLAAFQRIRVSSSREKEVYTCRLVQRIMRKHQSAWRVQFNYTISVAGCRNSGFMEGIYFLSYATETHAVYASLQSARKTLTFDSMRGVVLFNSASSGEIEVKVSHKKHLHEEDIGVVPQEGSGQVSGDPSHGSHHHLGRLEYHKRVVKMTHVGRGKAHLINVKFNGPVIVHVENGSAKGAIDCVKQMTDSSCWQAAVRQLDYCNRIRRRMKVPMLALRLNALTSVQESALVASNHVSDSSTLLGWGEAESLFGPADPKLYLSLKHTAETLRQELQHNILSLPRPSLVFGISENRIITMYAMLIALLEYIDERRKCSAVAGLSEGLIKTTWVDELLATGEFEYDLGTATRSPKEKGSPRMSSRINKTDDDFILPPSMSARMSGQPTNHHPAGRAQRHGGSSPFPRPGMELSSFPTFSEVLLGVVRAGSGDAYTKTLTVHRVSSMQESLKKKARHTERHGVDGNVNFSAAKSKSINLNYFSFTLFDAEDCRKRIYRLLKFVKKYEAHRRNSAKSGYCTIETGGLQQTICKEQEAFAEEITSPYPTCVDNASFEPLLEHAALHPRKQTLLSMTSQPVEGAAAPFTRCSTSPKLEMRMAPTTHFQSRRRRRSASLDTTAQISAEKGRGSLHRADANGSPLVRPSSGEQALGNGKSTVVMHQRKKGRLSF